jgi:hypothetical protein
MRKNILLMTLVIMIARNLTNANVTNLCVSESGEKFGDRKTTTSTGVADNFDSKDINKATESSAAKETSNYSSVGIFSKLPENEIKIESSSTVSATDQIYKDATPKNYTSSDILTTTNTSSTTSTTVQSVSNTSSETYNSTDFPPSINIEQDNDSEISTLKMEISTDVTELTQEVTETTSSTDSTTSPTTVSIIQETTTDEPLTTTTEESLTTPTEEPIKGMCLIFHYQFLFILKNN